MAAAPRRGGLNLLQLVRDSTSTVMNEARHVSINKEALRSLATSLIDSGRLSAEAMANGVSWDAEGWHYQGDAATAGPLTCQYIMVLDSLNFCFWPTPGLEYEHLARGLKRVLTSDSTALNADKLSQVTEEQVASWLEGGYQWPQLAERVHKVREVGMVLSQSFGGQASQLVAQANHSAVELVRLITAHFPGFRDEVIYHGRQVHLYKRAQIMVGDIWAAYGMKKPPHPYGFYDMDQVTMFADYRVPQILQARKVLEYAPDLERRIASKEVIPYGSEEEVEIRAATVQAVEGLKEEIRALGGGEVMVISLDWLLWQEGEKVKEEIGPHHRTLTIFY